LQLIAPLGSFRRARGERARGDRLPLGHSRHKWSQPSGQILGRLPRFRSSEIQIMCNILQPARLQIAGYVGKSTWPLGCSIEVLAPSAGFAVWPGIAPPLLQAAAPSFDLGLLR